MIPEVLRIYLEFAQKVWMKARAESAITQRSEIEYWLVYGVEVLDVDAIVVHMKDMFLYVFFYENLKSTKSIFCYIENDLDILRAFIKKFKAKGHFKVRSGKFYAWMPAIEESPFPWVRTREQVVLVTEDRYWNLNFED